MAHDAAVDAVVLQVPVDAGERSFGPTLLGDVVLLRGQSLAERFGVRVWSLAIGFLHTGEAIDGKTFDARGVWRRVRIDIWSDVVCPWCYLGSRRFKAALDRSDLSDVRVRWRAYQLDPGAPREPGDLRSTLDRKYGTGAFDSMTKRLTALGADVGIDFRFDSALRVNTSDAHRLISWAGTQGPTSADGPQDVLVQRLFRDYFTAGADLGDRSVLVAAAAAAGLDEDVAGEVLASTSQLDVIQADQEEAVELGITGVPAFVIDDQWVIPGAQEADDMVRLLSRVRGSSESAR